MRTPMASAPPSVSWATALSSAVSSTSATTTFMPSVAKRSDEREADAAGAAGDDGDLAVELAHQPWTSAGDGPMRSAITSRAGTSTR